MHNFSRRVYPHASNTCSLHLPALGDLGADIQVTLRLVCQVHYQAHLGDGKFLPLSFILFALFFRQTILRTGYCSSEVDETASGPVLLAVLTRRRDACSVAPFPPSIICSCGTRNEVVSRLQAKAWPLWNSLRTKDTNFVCLCIVTKFQAE